MNRETKDIYERQGKKKNFTFIHLFTYSYLSVESIMTVLYICIDIPCHDKTGLHTFL